MSAMLWTSLLCMAAAPAATPVDAYAIVVGHNGGLSSGPGHGPLPRLRYADDDALRFAHLFSAFGKVALLATPDEDTRAEWAKRGLELPDHRPATREALLAALADLDHELKARPAGSKPPAVFFVYAGHGLPGRFLLQNDDAQESSLTGRELLSALSGLPASRATVFLDACRAQSLFTSRGDDDFSAEVARLEDRVRALPVGIITAATSDTPAGETPRLRGGYFSHVLASALAGAADADGDQLVRFGELAAFVAFHTERQVGQRPWFEPPAGNLEAVVVDLRTELAVTLAPELEGRFRIEQRTGTVAEVQKLRGQPMALVVPAGDFTVAQESAGEQREVVVSRRDAIRRLTASDFEAVAATRGDEPFDAQAQVPFSNDAVAALAAGYRSGQRADEPTSLPFHMAVAARYGLSSAPAFTALEHGVELAWSIRVGGRLLVGPRLSLRTATFEGLEGLAHWWRGGLLLEAGLEFVPASWLSLTPQVSLGVKSIWRESPTGLKGNPVAPAAGLGLRLGTPVSPHVSIDLELRVEAAVVSLSTGARLYAEPQALLGVSWRWR